MLSNSGFCFEEGMTDVVATVRNCSKNCFLVFIICGTKAITWKGSLRKVFLKILENSEENIFAGVSFSKGYRPSGLQLYLKETPAQVFPYEFEKLLRACIL